MAVYRKKLLDKDGNTIIPAIGDIYGTVYTATLSSATAGGRADYDFTPDTPVENNKVYAVQFPAPTVNNATIILGDGVSSGSILVPPVSATDSPNYELLNTDMINDTEPLLLLYNGVQWVCLNQKKKVATADLENGAVSLNKVNFTTSTKCMNLGGVKIMWGKTTVVMNGTSANSFGATTVSLPESFKDNSYSVVATPEDPTVSNAIKCTVQSVNASNFQITVGTAAAVNIRNVPVRWIAIG